MPKPVLGKGRGAPALKSLQDDRVQPGGESTVSMEQKGNVVSGLGHTVTEDSAVTQRSTIAGSHPCRLCMSSTREEVMLLEPRGVVSWWELEPHWPRGGLASPLFPWFSLLSWSPAG